MTMGALLGASLALMSRACKKSGTRVMPDAVLIISSEDALENLKIYGEIAETLDRKGVVYDMGSSSGVVNVEIYDEIEASFIEQVKSRYNSKSEVVTFRRGGELSN